VSLESGVEVPIPTFPLVSIVNLWFPDSEGESNIEKERVEDDCPIDQVLVPRLRVAIHPSRNLVVEAPMV
jgi:hypothetical protein